MTRKPYQQGRIYAGRLPLGADLVTALTRIANEEEVKVGTVAIYGTLSRLTLTIYNHATGSSETIEQEGGLEIANLSGTISQFKGRSMARLSGTFLLPGGGLIGGGVMLGSTIHACEVVITELVGGTLSRDFDMTTGLPLWKESSMLIGE